MQAKSSIKRIAIIGPESSGKSVLCAALADHYQTIWVKEYAREYLTQLGRAYQADDIILIYKNQFETEKKFIENAHQYIFIDTEFIIAKVWLEHAFRKSSSYLEEMIIKHQYDLYLLTTPDLPWVYDPLRENKGQGGYFFDWYKKILDIASLPYRIVSGQLNERTGHATRLIDEYFHHTDQ